MLTWMHAYMLACLHVYMRTLLQVYLLAWLHAYCLNDGMVHAYRQREQLICGEFSTSAYRQQAQLRPKDTMTSLNDC